LAIDGAAVGSVGRLRYPSLVIPLLQAFGVQPPATNLDARRAVSQEIDLIAHLTVDGLQRRKRRQRKAQIAVERPLLRA
jgi:predicted component of type VI protein secretion system